MRDLGEILILGSNRPLKLLLIQPGDRIVDVVPKDWFNQGEWDFDYQWVTQVVRDPADGRIVGVGIRLGLSRLDETMRQIDRWHLAAPFFFPGTNVDDPEALYGHRLGS